MDANVVSFPTDVDSFVMVISYLERDELIPQEIDIQPFLPVDKSLGPHFICICSIIEPLVCS